jgi:hypothetical protein
MEKSSPVKDGVKWRRREATNWEKKEFANNISFKGLVSGISKEFLKFSSLKNPIRKLARK